MFGSQSWSNAPSRSSDLLGVFNFMEDDMSVELLSGVSGVILSLSFTYLPGLRVWFEQLTSQGKSLVMLVLLAVVAGSIFGLSCANVLGYVTCDNEGAYNALTIFINALVANQGVYLVTRKL